MTSLVPEFDSQLLIPLLFWTVVVVALVVSTTSGERRVPEDFDLGRATPPGARRARGPLRPFRGRGRRQAARRKTRIEISGGMPRRIG